MSKSSMTVQLNCGLKLPLNLGHGWVITYPSFMRMLLLIHAINLTHWGRVTHICVSNLTIIGLDNGLSPGRRQANICTNGGILLIRPLGTNFNEILIRIQTFSFKKIHVKNVVWKMAAILSQPQCVNGGLTNQISERALGNFIFFYPAMYGHV